jgi:hypothetical protein
MQISNSPGMIKYYKWAIRTTQKDNKLQEVSLRLALLRDKERKEITLRFGFNGEDPLTLESIGEGLGLAPKKVHKSEQRPSRNFARSAIRGATAWSPWRMSSRRTFLKASAFPAKKWLPFLNPPI